MILIGKGQLRHHFWGDYHATIVVYFDTLTGADIIAAALPGFTRHDAPQGKEGVAFRFHGTGDALKAAEQVLVNLGADRKKLTSVARSIDYGEPFTIEVGITPSDNAQQLNLL